MPDSILLAARPCVKCGAIDRYKNGDCKPCNAIRMAANYKENREKKMDYAKAYRAKNPEKVKASQARYRAENPEKIQAKNAEYRAGNKDKIGAYLAAYYQANRRALLTASRMKNAENPSVAKEWRKKNQVRLKESLSAWRRANTERVAATTAAWAKANPEARRINQQNRRARELNCGGQLSKGLAPKLFKLQQGKCPCCAMPLGDDPQLDHKMPLALGGSNTDDNMQLLRKVCNLQKHAKHPIDFMQERGFLL